MSSQVAVQFADDVDPLDESLVASWVKAACSEQHGDVCVRFVGEQEGKTLNQRFRNIDRPTNVLSFTANEDGILGDIAICMPTAMQEADEQDKTLAQHLAHLVVHGTLHLCGFDHTNHQDSQEMESLEIGILSNLGFPDPYSKYD